VVRLASSRSQRAKLAIQQCGHEVVVGAGPSKANITAVNEEQQLKQINLVITYLQVVFMDFVDEYVKY